MRTERTHLQNEVEILGQKLTQKSLTLKDELRGMFNDRKMAVRMEQRAMESAIQELNYKITVTLNSDSKGEVEGLRWTLTRRAAMAIAGMAGEFAKPFAKRASHAKQIISPHAQLLTLFLIHDTSAGRGTQKACCDINIIVLVHR